MSKTGLEKIKETFEKNDKDGFNDTFISLLPNTELLEHKWMNYTFDQNVFAMTKYLGGYDPSNPDYIRMIKAQNCYHFLLTISKDIGMVHIKLNSKDIPKEIIVGQILNTFSSLNVFQRFVCASYICIDKNTMLIPYKMMFKTDELCNSLFYLNIQANIPAKINEKKPELKKCYDCHYELCTINEAIHGYTLDFFLKQCSDAEFIIMFTRNLHFFNMCSGMCQLAFKANFVHNDAHCENVMIDGNTGEFKLIDFGKSYIDQNIVPNNNMALLHEFELSNLKFDEIFSYYQYIKPYRERNIVIPISNLASDFPIMCDIACICYNIYKRMLQIKPENETITHLKTILDVSDTNILMSDLNKFNIIGQNFKVIALGLIWMRGYIKCVFKSSNFKEKLVIPMKYIEGPNKPLWYAGQISPFFYNSIKNDFDKMLLGIGFVNMMKTCFHENITESDAMDWESSESLHNGGSIVTVNGRNPLYFMPPLNQSMKKQQANTATNTGEQIQLNSGLFITFSQNAIKLDGMFSDDKSFIQKQYIKNEKLSIAYRDKCEKKMSEMYH
jgi:dimeric dUTPase (all-alpha-NTP-PPase superfamily)